MGGATFFMTTFRLWAEFDLERIAVSDTAGIAVATLAVNYLLPFFHLL